METASSKHSHFTLPKRGVFNSRSVYEADPQVARDMQEVIFSKAPDGHIAMLNHTMGRTVFVCEHSILPNMHQIAILKQAINHNPTFCHTESKIIGIFYRGHVGKCCFNCLRC